MKSPEAIGLLDLCDRNAISLGKACEGAGQRYGTVHSQVRNNRKMPFSTILAFARFFDVPLEYFTADRADVALHSTEGRDALQKKVAQVFSTIFRDQRDKLLAEGFAIGTDEVLDWLARNNGRLEDFDTLRESVDLFHPVPDGVSALHPDMSISDQRTS